MNFQQLRSVREAVRRGFNLTEVAAALHTSQPGVSRQMTIDMAKQLGISCTAGDIDMFDAANAEEMFLTSTSLCILPVRSFNGAPVADGKIPGPITKKLIDAYAKSVGCDFVAQYLKFSQ